MNQAAETSISSTRLSLYKQIAERINAMAEARFMHQDAVLVCIEIG